MKHLRLLALLPLLFAVPAHAQEDVQSRLDQLEQDLLLMKRHQSRPGASSSPPMDGGVAGAQTDVRLSALEEELRGLRGKMEENDFQIRKTADEMERFRRDMELRLSDMEKAAAASPAATPQPATPSKPPAETTPAHKPELSVKEVPLKPEDEPAAAGKAADETKAEEPAAPPAGETPRDRYNYAFRLLNQNQYEEAARSFADFTKKYPKDPLVGNAYYWQGETYYIRKDYATAADNFRQGFESMPSGPKAADNLLKLGMSLAALKKKEEACVVLAQVMTKYKTASANTAAKAQAEHKRASCGE